MREKRECGEGKSTRLLLHRHISYPSVLVNLHGNNQSTPFLIVEYVWRYQASHGRLTAKRPVNESSWLGTKLLNAVVYDVN